MHTQGHTRTSCTGSPGDITDWDYNRCVPDPIGQVNGLRLRGEIMGFNMGEGFPDPRNTDYHWQGIQRLGVADRKYFVVDGDFKDESRFALVHMGTRDTSGRRMRGNRMSRYEQDWKVQPSSLDRIAHNELVSTSFQHPGGMQALGRYLFVPLEEGNGFARMFNFDMGELTDPLSCDQWTGQGCPKKIWEFGFATPKAAVAAITKLRYGEGYLMITAREDSNVLELYVSKPGYRLSDPNVFGTKEEWGVYDAMFDRRYNEDFRTYYQNLNLITACPERGYETGQLYLLGTTGRTKADRDTVDLFELSIAPGADRHFPGTEYTVHMDLVASRPLICTAVSGERQCDLDAAAGVYVDQDGRLTLYATEHDNDGPPGSGPDGSVKMMEFRAMDHLDDPDIAGTQGCSNLDEAFVELYDRNLDFGWGWFYFTGPTNSLPTYHDSLFVQYIDRTKRAYSFGTAYDLDNKVLSVRYCIPPGYKYRIFADEFLWGDYETLRGDASIPGIGNPSDGMIQGYNWGQNRGWSSGCFMRAEDTWCPWR